MSDSEKNFLLLQWLKLSIKKETLSERLFAGKCNSVAVCGFREYGRLLVEMLEGEGMKIACIIEKNYQSLQIIEDIEVPILGFQKEINSIGADVIIVTPDLDILEVRENLEIVGITVPMIGLEQLLLSQAWT